MNIYLCYFFLALEIKETARSFCSNGLFYSVLENCNLGFGLITYTQNKEEVVDIREKISACKFKKEDKHIYEGAHVFRFLNYDEWKQRCQDLMRTYFSRDGQDSGIITFPETNITAQGKPWQSVMSTLKQWCKNSNSRNIKEKDDATGIITRNYDFKNHLDFCKVTNESKKVAYHFNSGILKANSS